ncbi:MAG: hypothetical protein ACJAZO_003955 [Myxococcota bacterium]|jgi:hypothetical protein
MRWLLAMTAVIFAVSAHAGTVRMGLFVGVNVGLGDDSPLSFAEDEARDVARIFNDMGDLSRERTRVLHGGTAAGLRDAMVATEAQIREATADGDEVLLLFYYSGHASRHGLHMNGTTLSLDEVRRWLEGSAAQVRIAFVDACESGGLAQVRGGTPTEAIAITVDDTLNMSGLAVVTSTGPLSVARESAQFGGGVFSRALMTGLRGTADSDADGVITLDEAYRHAFRATVLGTASTGVGVQRPEYRYEIAGVGEVVLTRVPSSAAGLVLPEESEGTYAVVSVNTGQVVARVDKQPGTQRRIALPTGRYLVRKVRREDVLVAELDLVWGGDRWIEDSSMSAMALGDPLARGGWSRRPLRLSLDGTIATPFINGNPVLSGVEVSLSARIRPTLEAVGGLGVSRGGRHDWEGELGMSFARARLGVMALRPTRWVDVSAGGGVQMAIAQQDIRYFVDDGDDYDALRVRNTQVFPGLWAGSSVHLPVGPTAGLQAGLRAHLYRATVDSVVGVFVEGQLHIGLTIGLGGRRIGSASRRRDTQAGESP